MRVPVTPPTLTDRRGGAVDYVDDLVATVRATAARLRQVSDADAARPPAPGRWSAKQVVGHLIDSASNNHQRFVRATWQEDLVVVPYDQDAWVARQDYQSAPWAELVDLWATYNAHLARVMRSVPAAVRLREHAPHNLDETAWQPVPGDRPATLDSLMRDYVAHVQHHVRQIEAMRPIAAGPPARRPRTLVDLMGTLGFFLAFIAMVIGLVQIARWITRLL
jgi:hypothetical protein